ncbi:MAG: DUF177 domain-containing protein [Desulfobacteraceae bacterium]|nr:DUF177 domain-containing protein [Desulfobacteraceae bacterium]
MKIRLDDIPETGRQITLGDAAWFPEGDWERVGPVAGELVVTRQGRRATVAGRLAFAVRLACDCCLEPFVYRHDGDCRLNFEFLPPGDPYWTAVDHQCPESELEVVALSEPEIDLGEALSQQVILLLPVKRLCVESCQGLCPVCGGNLNLSACACRDQQSASPFTVLAGLKNKQ